MSFNKTAKATNTWRYSRTLRKACRANDVTFVQENIHIFPLPTPKIYHSFYLNPPNPLKNPVKLQISLSKYPHFFNSSVGSFFTFTKTPTKPLRQK